MQEFDCLEKQNLSGRVFIEASAGTGKTFAIEHVVARLILQNYPLNKILITTFTNAGVRDLKQRIYKNLRNLIETKEPPPYFDRSIGATFSLKNALRLIDEAEIHTIHSFCHRMLSEFSFEANIDPLFLDPEKGFKKESIEIATLDVLRTLVDSTEFSPAMLTRLMSPFQKEIKRFVKKMAGFLSANPEITSYRTYEALQKIFISFPKEDLTELAFHYNKTSSREGKLHLFVQKQITALVENDFETLLATTPSIFTLFTESNQKKQSTLKTHPLITALAPIIYEASDPFILFLRVAKKVASRLEDRREGPNVLLETMQKALLEPDFKRKVSEKFQAIIIDEFQDTDPIQWNIFSTLTPAFLLVVGDPKQSIYAFRGADLKTFLQAKEEFSNRYRLSLNYRSDPLLIDDLNHLFQIHDLFTLSEKSINFSYEPVIAKKKPSQKLSEPRLQFVLSPSSEETIFFSYIAQEASRFVDSFSCAVLVQDRFEAERLSSYLQEVGLSVLTTSAKSITEGNAFAFLYTAAKLARSPKNESLQKQFLLHPFSRHLTLEPKTLYELKELAYIESKEDAIDFEQLISLVLEENPPFLYSYLEKLAKLDPDDHPYLKRKTPAKQNAVTIMTSHMSKGLEFDIIFSLGTTAQKEYTPLKPPLEQDLEKIRLFYVAATRAKEKLYLFVAPEKKSPVALLLAKLASNTTPYNELLLPPLETLEKLLTEQGFPTITLTSPLSPPIKEIPALKAPKKALILPSFLPKKYTSFSSLIEAHPGNKASIDSLLPKGPETGNLFHLLLEKMIETGLYFDWNEKKIETFIEEELFKTHLQGLEHLVYELLHAAFFTPLDSFSLKDIPPEHMLQEHPFLYKLDENSYMKGFIDLVFFHNDHYYILDWKLNLLPDYTEESLKLAMEEHSYYTQAEIYKCALSKALQSYPCKHFIYFFLRGKQNGILKL